MRQVIAAVLLAAAATAGAQDNQGGLPEAVLVQGLPVAFPADVDSNSFVFSAYPNAVENQGIAVARMAWSDRDRPASRVFKWRAGEWTAPGVDGRATPIYGARVSWHEGGADAFWGPSVHWNTFLNKYVMLMTRARDSAFANEGIYVAYADRLEDPSAWSQPQRLLEGGAWYPQVMGLERGRGPVRLLHPFRPPRDALARRPRRKLIAAD